LNLSRFRYLPEAGIDEVKRRSKRKEK